MANEPLVSFVITTFNKSQYITKILEAILKQNYPRKKLEIIVVDDNSTDDTPLKIKQLQRKFKDIQFFVKSPVLKKGPAASSNFGIKRARGEFIASVDGDALIFSGWLRTLLKEFTDKNVGIVSGLIYTANPQNLWATFAGRELEDRMLRLKTKEVDSISPCNTLYRKEIFQKIGLFDEAFDYYAQDVDFCYRAIEAGYKILVSQKTGCKHFWREGFFAWLKQIYGTGYGRLIVVSKFPQKKTGDPVSGWKLIFQVPLSLLFLIILLSYLLFRLPIFLLLAFFCLIILLLMQIPVTLRIIMRTGDFRFLIFPLALILRNLTWVWVVFKYQSDKQFRRLF